MFRSVLLVLAFLIPITSLAEANIPVKHRVKNQQPGYCCWASIETLCKHQGVEQGYGLVESRKKDPDKILWDGRILRRNEGDDYSVEEKLGALGVKYQINHTGFKTKEGLRLIVKATESGHGAVVGVWRDPIYHQHHAITIIDINSESFEYIDSNFPTQIWKGGTEWFLEQWDGFVVVVEK